MRDLGTFSTSPRATGLGPWLGVWVKHARLYLHFNFGIKTEGQQASTTPVVHSSQPICAVNCEAHVLLASCCLLLSCCCLLL